MKRFVCLIIGMLSFGALLAQTLAWEGVWVLDSVQVKEIMPDSIVEKTVLPGERALLDAHWMNRFKLDTDGKASYTEVAHSLLTDEQSYAVTNAPYELTDRIDNSATLIINSVPEYKILNIQLLSGYLMCIKQSFTTGYNRYDIEISWKMYYRRMMNN